MRSWRPVVAGVRILGRVVRAVENGGHTVGVPSPVGGVEVPGGRGEGDGGFVLAILRLW